VARKPSKPRSSASEPQRNRAIPYTWSMPDGSPNPEVVQRIIELMCEEGHTLLQISKMEMMPSFFQIWKWRKNFEGFDKLIKEAELVHASYIDDECLDIADEDAFDAVDVMRNRERINIRQKRAAKYDPERHAERKALPGWEPVPLPGKGQGNSEHITKALKAIEEKIASGAKVTRGGPRIINVTPMKKGNAQ
jgi:hypothetical protein